MKFRIRTMLIVIAIFAIPLGWYTSNLAESQREEQLVSQLQIEGRGFRLLNSTEYIFCGMGVVGVAQREPISLTGKIGSYFQPAVFERVIEISLDSEKYGDDSLDVVVQFPHLKELMLVDTRVSKKRLSAFIQKHQDVRIYVSSGGFDGCTFDDLDEPFEAEVFGS